MSSARDVHIPSNSHWPKPRNMSTPSAPNTPNLLTLPPHILIKILTYLRNDVESDPDREPRPPNFPPVQHSLSLQKCLTIRLSSALLPIATVSPILARVAAKVTGAQHTYLTPQTTDYQLCHWVRALAPFVKAVAADNYNLEPLADFTGPERHSLYSNLLSDSLQLFDALSTNLVKLEVLDLTHIPFRVHRMNDALLTALYSTLESNNATLRELALPAYEKSDLFACALELVTLRRLEVFTVDLRDTLTSRTAYVSCEPISRMLQALDSHADRACSITKMQDLRILNDSGALRTKALSGLSESFLKSVRILRLKTVRRPFSRTYYSRSYSPRLSMFPHLECLYWNEMPSYTVDFLPEVRHVREIHFCDVRWFTLPQLGTEEVEDRCVSVGGYSSDWRIRKMKDVFLYEDCMRTFMVRRELHLFDVVDLPRVCKYLENVSFIVSSKNVEGLWEFLKRSKRLRVLELILDEAVTGRLKADDWVTIAKAMKASKTKSLSQFAILAEDDNAGIVRCVNSVVNCCVDVVESIGSRARCLAFQVGLSPRRIVSIYDGISKILKACKKHTPGLELLKIDLFVRRLRNVDTAEVGRARRELIFAKKEVLQSIKSLRKLEFGLLNKVFDQRRHDDVEGVKQ